MRKIVLICTLFIVGATAAPVGASPSVQYGIQDDAWLQYGDGTLDERIAELDALGVDLVRYTLNWHVIEPRRAERDWSSSDAVLQGLRSAVRAGRGAKFRLRLPEDDLLSPMLAVD